MIQVQCLIAAGLLLPIWRLIRHCVLQKAKGQEGQEGLHAGPSPHLWRKGLVTPRGPSLDTIALKNKVQHEFWKGIHTFKPLHPYSYICRNTDISGS